ncbi:MAG: apolipoprotein N-acyltransferase, partial [Helicobacteraceae bacterium]|nr:apolipoprotein N-acyltransferase [Helicobacteraceae bacterium]
MRDFRKRNPNTTALINALLGALCLSAFVYFEAAALDLRPLNTICALFGFAIWLIADKKTAFLLGFFVALLWFWWIGLSFLYTEYPPLAFVAPIAIALIYAVIFFAFAWLPIYARAAAIAFGFWLIEPFGFAWFKPELVLASGYFSVNRVAFPLLIAAILCVIYAKKRRFLFAISAACFIGAFVAPEAPKPKAPNLNITLARTNIDQSIKWQKSDLPRQIAEVFKLIDEAIAQKADLIVLPEAAIATFLNREEEILDELLTRSFSIAIVLGGLHLKSSTPYNSAYIFQNGRYKIADKVFLVPFGEASPLPSWAGRLVNRLFFDDAIDYVSASNPTDFTIGDYRFRAAICYEAAIEAMYRDAPPYMIAISNNGWFTPSIEPTLQKLLMRLYAKR